ncbi:transposase [Nocardia gamkensis]|uniref:transposase n=1 Tax=Nocardia gamkensis TaxID=352869 RepID=UPI0036E21F3B
MLAAGRWPTGTAEPIDYWLATLPPSIPLRALVQLAKIRWRIEHDYHELKDGLGLDRFEGRSWLGRHRHVPLAQAICTTLRHTPKTPLQARPSTPSCADSNTSPPQHHRPTPNKALL